jgi:hypothetical protein
MQDLGNDAFRTKDRHHIFLAELIRFHQRAKDFDRRSIRNRMMLFSTQTRVPPSHQNKEDLMNTTTVSSSCIPDPVAISAKTVSSRCPYVYPNGKRCSLPGLPEHSGNCLRHSHANSPIALPVQSDSEDLSADLLPELSEFSAGTDIRQFLARLLTLVTKGRISPRPRLRPRLHHQPTPPLPPRHHPRNQCRGRGACADHHRYAPPTSRLARPQTPRPQAPRSPHEHNNLLGETASYFTVQSRDGCATNCAGY